MANRQDDPEQGFTHGMYPGFGRSPNIRTTARTRYFDRATTFVKYAVMKMLIATELVPTEDMIADIFTKSVDQDTFRLMRSWLLNSANDANAKGMYSRITRMLTDMQSIFGRM